MALPQHPPVEDHPGAIGDILPPPPQPPALEVMPPPPPPPPPSPELYAVPPPPPPEKRPAGKTIGVLLATGAALVAGAVGLKSRGGEEEAIRAERPPAAATDESPREDNETVTPSENDSSRSLEMPPLVIDGTTIERIHPDTDWRTLLTDSDDPEEILESIDRIHEFTYNYGYDLEEGSLAPMQALYVDYATTFSPEYRDFVDETIDETNALRNTYDRNHYQASDSVLTGQSALADGRLRLEVTNVGRSAFEENVTRTPMIYGGYIMVKEIPPEEFDIDHAVWRVQSIP